MNDPFQEKNAKLSLGFDAYITKHPKLLTRIPNGAYIVITLSNDKDFNAASLSLIKDKRRKTVVEARKSGRTWSIRPLHASSS